MHIAPRASPPFSDEAPKVGHRYTTARMATAEEPRIIARFIARISTVVQSFLHVIDNFLRFHDLAVVFPYQTPIRSYQHHVDEVANGTIGLFLSTQLETRQRLIDVPGTAG